MRAILLCWLLWLPVAAFAATAPSPPDEDESETKAWVEQEVTLPAFPQTASLAEFHVSPASGSRFLLDTKTLSIGADGVVRYALVVRTAGGAENTSFEGIRCATREQKAYAFGQRNGSWSAARDAQWRPIELRDFNRAQPVLYADFLCMGSARPPRDVRAIVQRLRYNRN